MSIPPRSSVFLERRRYRRRRMDDAAKLLPVVGTVLLAVPLLWSDTVSTSGALLYLFGIWAVLIVVSFLIGRALSGSDDATPDRR